jgi:hypothetical protein
MLEAYAGGGATAQAIRSDRGHRAIACAPTYSEWFSRFMTGLKSRIGERRKQDAAISITLMVEIQRRLELEWQLATGLMNKDRVRAAAEHGSFHVLTYCGSLRGFETPKVVLHDLIHQTLSPEEALEAASRGNKTPPHVSLPLKGRFKARSQEVQRRIIDICWETKSGLKPGVWTRRLIEALKDCGISSGWAYTNKSSNIQLKMSDFA